MRKTRAKSKAALDIKALLLASGSHRSPEEGMCVMELCSYLAHEPFSDHPQCASPVISAGLRSWNDSLDDDARQMLKPLAQRLIGTAAPAHIEAQRAWMAVDWLIRVYTPAWLELAKLQREADGLKALPEITDAGSLEAAKPLIAAAKQSAQVRWLAARAAARDAAGGAARGAAWDAVGGAAWLAARDAAWDAARDAAGDAAWDAAWLAAGDAVGGAAWLAARDAAWDAARDAAGDAAWDAAWLAAGDAARDAARDALKPTVVFLQKAALVLFERMISAWVGRE